MTYDPNQPRDPAGVSTGGEWTVAEASARKAAGLPPVGSVAKYSDISKGDEMGKGYILSGSDDLYDITNEFGGGTNDHVGFVALSENPEVFGMAKQDAKDFLTAYENLDGDGMGDGWQKFYDSGAIRVREFGNEIAVDSKALNTKTLERLQYLHGIGKFGFAPGQKLTWSDNFEMNTLRDISLEEFLQAEYVSRHETSPGVVEPYIR